ncbi:hypothetical protein DEE50_39985, partial [Burkholderia cepacia]|nr:hypothetical protein [Burkholderia cepacia]MBB0058726.1 hypothetical protein [Burkholderia cepacia]MBB0125624.1 hypothetical protein [Burkholderia cepacia]MBB0154818.1 hypothetical protein [Burkholderia cepacia]MBB0187081.1 hypothetical protein [Burkholderia cepacia]
SASDSRRRVDNLLFNRLAHKNADRFGVWHAEGKVCHPIASKLVDRTELLGALPTTSREFC